MKRILLSLIAAGLISASSAQIVVSGNITSNQTWTNDNIYLLSGYVFIKSGATVTIEPGTIIKGEKSTQGTLIVDRGGKLVADGTSTQPIVFTSDQAPGVRTYSDWGGIVICGDAPVNLPGGVGEIEGFTTGTTSYGGSNAADSSGVLRYVRIEFGGIPLQPNKEINGLTLAGVGSKTVIDYIQCSYIGDDNYEFFGGTVNAKHLIGYRGLDDDFDCDNGWNGNVQWALSFRDPVVADISGSNGFECDNDASGSTATPQTSGWFSNVTIVGPKSTSSTTINSNYTRALHLRRNSAMKIYNSIFIGYPTGLLIDGTLTEGNADGGSLKFKHNILCNMADTLAVTSSSTWNIGNFFYNATFGNDTVYNPSTLMLVDPFNLSAPNAQPATGSPVLTGADFTDLGAWFTPVSYIGALGATDWTSSWTNFDPINTNYVVGIEDDVLSASAGITVFPNPFNGSAFMNLTLVKDAAVNIEIVDLTGKLVASTGSLNLGAGTHNIELPVSDLAAGMYIARVVTASGVKTVKISCTK